MTRANQPLVAIISQHAEEASFLALQRIRAVCAPHFALRDLTRLDDRISAHLDGLRVAGDVGRQACDAQVADGDRGALFADMVLALEAKDVGRIDTLLSLSETAPPLQPSLISGFGWISAPFLQGTAKDLLTAETSFRRRVGIASCVLHGVDPGPTLERAMSEPDPVLRPPALRAAGQLGKIDLRHICERSLRDPDPACRFGAAWATVLLGNRGTALEALTRIGLEPGTHRKSAFRLMLQATSVSAAHGVLQPLAGDSQQLRWLIQGSGIAGDPQYVAWLIRHMANEKTARLAGEAFSFITGVDLSQSALDGQQPEGFESGPNDEPDDPNVEMDPDDGLPWPDAAKIEKWWDANSSRFQKGTRYFMGAPVTREHCIDVLKNGYQRQRILAAHYLCLLEPGAPLFNTSAPAWRQRRLLANMT